MNHTCLYSPAASITSLWLVLIAPTHKGVGAVSTNVYIIWVFCSLKLQAETGHGALHNVTPQRSSAGGEGRKGGRKVNNEFKYWQQTNEVITEASGGGSSKWVPVGACTVNNVSPLKLVQRSSPVTNANLTHRTSAKVPRMCHVFVTPNCSLNCGIGTEPIYIHIFDTLDSDIWRDC